MNRLHDPAGIYYVTSQLTRVFSSVSGSSPTVVAGGGANGRDCIRCASSQNFTLTLDAQATWTLGARIRPATITNSTPIFTVLDGATIQWDVVKNTDGTISVRRGGTVVLGTSVAAFSAAETAFLECKVVISDTVGTIEVRKAGVAILGPTGSLDTKNSANASGNVIRWGTTGGSDTVDFQDLYVNDGTTAAHNSFEGDSRTDVQPVNGNGDDSGFVGSDLDSVDNYLLVDDVTPDDDTTYVEAAAAASDLYAVTNLASTPADFKAVTIVTCLRKNDAGDVTARNQMKVGTTIYQGGDIAVSDTYLFKRATFETNPDTAAAWTEAGFNAIQIGPARTA